MQELETTIETTMPVAEVETTMPVEETLTETPPEPKPILSIKYNGQDMSIFDEVEAKELAEMGKFYKEKGKAELENYRKNANAIKTLEEMAIASGYDDVNEYVSTSQRSNSIENYVSNAVNEGVDETYARLLADIAIPKFVKTEQPKEQPNSRDTEINEFIEKYPSFDASKPLPSSVYDDWNSGKSLIGSYEKYLEVEKTTALEQRALALENENKALKGIKSNAEATIGSLNETGDIVNATFYTKAQVDLMTPQEQMKKATVIRESMQKW